MGGSAGVMARLLFVAFIAVVGMGIWAFMINTDLDAAKGQLESITKERDTWKTRMTQYQSEGQTVAANLEQCTASVTDLQAQMEALAAKKPAARR